MTPEYFHTRLTYYEAKDYISGYNRRHRAIYEAARMLHGEIGGLFAKNYKMPEFPWDNEARQTATEYTDEEIAELREEGDKWAEELNNARS